MDNEGPLTGITLQLAELLSEFQASVAAAQQTRHACDQCKTDIRRSTQAEEPYRAPLTAEQSVADSADVALIKMQGQTEAAAAAAAQHATVVSQLIGRVGKLSRRCDASSEQLQQLHASLAALQQGAAEVQAQLALAAGNQQAAASQMTQVLSINKHLQHSVEELCAELDEEKAARRKLTEQLDRLQQQVCLQEKSVHVLQHAVSSNTADLEQLQASSSQTNNAVVALTASKQQLHKQLQRMLRFETQLNTNLKDTQQVVAGELAAVRRHVQLANNRAAQSSRANRAALTAHLDAVSARVELLQQQLILLKTAAAGSGAQAVNKFSKQSSNGRSTPAAVALSCQQSQRQRRQKQQERQEQQQYNLLAEALMSSEPSSATNVSNTGQGVMQEQSAGSAEFTASAPAGKGFVFEVLGVKDTAVGKNFFDDEDNTVAPVQATNAARFQHKPISSKQLSNAATAAVSTEHRAKSASSGKAKLRRDARLGSHSKAGPQQPQRVEVRIAQLQAQIAGHQDGRQAGCWVP